MVNCIGECLRRPHTAIHCFCEMQYLNTRIFSSQQFHCSCPFEQIEFLQQYIDLNCLNYEILAELYCKYLMNVLMFIIS